MHRYASALLLRAFSRTVLLTRLLPPNPSLLPHLHDSRNASYSPALASSYPKMRLIALSSPITWHTRSENNCHFFFLYPLIMHTVNRAIPSFLMFVFSHCKICDEIDFQKFWSVPNLKDVCVKCSTHEDWLGVSLVNLTPYLQAGLFRCYANAKAEKHHHLFCGSQHRASSLVPASPIHPKPSPIETGRSCCNNSKSKRQALN